VPSRLTARPQSSHLPVVAVSPHPSLPRDPTHAGKAAAANPESASGAAVVAAALAKATGTRYHVATVGTAAERSAASAASLAAEVVVTTGARYHVATVGTAAERSTASTASAVAAAAADAGVDFHVAAEGTAAELGAAAASSSAAASAPYGGYHTAVAGTAAERSVGGVNSALAVAARAAGVTTGALQRAAGHERGAMYEEVPVVRVSADGSAVPYPSLTQAAEAVCVERGVTAEKMATAVHTATDLISDARDCRNPSKLTAYGYAWASTSSGPLFEAALARIRAAQAAGRAPRPVGAQKLSVTRVSADGSFETYPSIGKAAKAVSVEQGVAQPSAATLIGDARDCRDPYKRTAYGYAWSSTPSGPMFDAALVRIGGKGKGKKGK
jgi:hypothetical protein